jgi:hypothetical protein
VTVLTDAEAKITCRKEGKVWGGDAREKRDEECCRLQVGVLVAMPSQVHTKTHDQELSGSPLRDGVAIGLIEIPWVERDPPSIA